MSEEIEDLKRRLRNLEDHAITTGQADTQRLANYQRERAQSMALQSIVLDLAGRAGVSVESFLRHYEIRSQWWHQYFLQQCENVSSQLSGELDQRTSEEVNADAVYPSIFDPPSSAQTDEE